MTCLPEPGFYDRLRGSRMMINYHHPKTVSLSNHTHNNKHKIKFTEKKT